MEEGDAWSGGPHIPGIPKKAKNQPKNNDRFAQSVWGVLRAPPPEKNRGKGPSGPLSDHERTESPKFFPTAPGRQEASREPEGDARSSPALGVFLLGSLMWNVDLSRRPEYREGAPQVFSLAHSSTLFFSFRISKLCLFFYPCFWVDMGGLSPKKQFPRTYFGLVNKIIFSWLTLFSKDIACKFATYKTRSGLKTTGFMTRGIAYCWTNASLYPQASD